MDVLLASLVVFISTFISLVTLGIIAGFSPTLYIAQITISSKAKKERTYTSALMAGVLVAVVLLIILFQTIHLETLLGFIDTTVRALTVSVVSNILIGGAFIYGGIWYLQHQKTPRVKPALKHTGGITSVFALGFLRTFVSVSGVTAIYIAGNIIASTSGSIIERLIYSTVFLAATIIQFFAIILLMKKGPKRLIKLTNRLDTLLRGFNYRRIVGAAAIILGGAIILINTVLLFTY